MKLPGSSTRVFFGENEAYRSFGWLGLGLMAVLVIATSIPGPWSHLRALWMRIAGRRLAPDDGLTDYLSEP